MTNPRIWPFLTDDYSPSAEDFQPNPSESIWYVLAKDGDAVLGVLPFVMLSRVVFEFHAALTPECWWTLGAAKAAALGAIAWIWANAPTCQRIVGYVPLLKHRTKLRFPPKLGMTQYGVNLKSFMKAGVLVDQVEFGVSRP